MDATRSAAAFVRGPALPRSPPHRHRRCGFSAQFLSTEGLCIDFSVPTRSGNFGNVFFGRYEPSGVDVVVKCPTESDLGRKLFAMERHTNQKLTNGNVSTAIRFPRYLGELIVPREAYVAPGLARIGLAWRLEGAGDTLEDYLSGGRMGMLASVLNTSAAGTLRRPLTAAVLTELLALLSDLQAAGIVHRDIKPANVLVVPDDPAPLKAIDFGSSCDWGSFLKHGLRLATCDPVYTAPERRIELLRPALKFDVYSVGLIALRCALPSLTEENAMAAFVRDVLSKNRSCLFRVCGGAEAGRLKIDSRLRVDLQVLSSPGNEDLLALLSTMLAQTPEERTDVASALRSRFLASANVLR